MVRKNTVVLKYFSDGAMELIYSLASWNKGQLLKICTTLSGESQWAHIGASSPRNKNPWVRRLLPIRRLVRMTSSLRV
jgi:hypothetical protein